MDSVYELLQEVPARHLTMDAVAKRANVGRPTLYKWWPSKAALLMAMFHERLAENPDKSAVTTVEASVRAKMYRVATSLNGLFGKVMGDLVAEGQSDPKVLQDLHNHICKRRVRSVAEIERGKSTGEFRHDIDSEVVVDMLLGPLYYRLLLGFRPLTRAYADQLTQQVMRAIKVPAESMAKRPQAKSPKVRVKSISDARSTPKKAR